MSSRSVWVRRIRIWTCSGHCPEHVQISNNDQSLLQKNVIGELLLSSPYIWKGKSFNHDVSVHARIHVNYGSDDGFVIPAYDSRMTQHTGAETQAQSITECHKDIAANLLSIILCSHLCFDVAYADLNLDERSQRPAEVMTSRGYCSSWTDRFWAVTEYWYLGRIRNERPAYRRSL